MEDNLKNNKEDVENPFNPKDEKDIKADSSDNISGDIKNISVESKKSGLTSNQIKINNSEDSNVGAAKDNKLKPKKEIPIEKKPFTEFINDNLFPSLTKEFKVRGFEIDEISLKNTIRPIAGDKCWIVYCEIRNTCNFWLSFEKDDITSQKSFSLCKKDQNPSVIESFLIDEKRITLNLIISRILQRLNGQKLIGIN